MFLCTLFFIAIITLFLQRYWQKIMDNFHNNYNMDIIIFIIVVVELNLLLSIFQQAENEEIYYM